MINRILIVSGFCAATVFSAGCGQRGYGAGNGDSDSVGTEMPAGTDSGVDTVEDSSRETATDSERGTGSFADSAVDTSTATDTVVSDDSDSGVSVDTDSQTADTDWPPVDTDWPPVDTDWPPVDTDWQPVDTDWQPVDTDWPPVDTDWPPVDTDWQPVDTDWQPVDTATELSDTGTGTETATDTDPVDDTTPDTVPDTVADTEPDTVADTEPDTVADTEPDTVADTEPDTVADTEPDTVADTEPDTVADTEPDTVADTASDTSPDTEPDTGWDTEPDTAWDTGTETVWDTETETASAPDTMTGGCEVTCVNGTCVDDGWTFECSCDSGWTGDACDVYDVCTTCDDTEACDGSVCYIPGLIDDFGDCDRSIEEIEGRSGEWYFYSGSGVDCAASVCSDVGVTDWDDDCGAWHVGGTIASPPAGSVWAGIGVGLNDSGSGPLYDACAYDGIEVVYTSDQPIRVYVKWNDTGEAGDRAAVMLPATGGPVSVGIAFSEFAGVDCAALTEIQFEPTDIPLGFGIAVYDVRFYGGELNPCEEADTRCGDSANVEICQDGSWTVLMTCESGYQCLSGECVEEDATPVALHGHLQVADGQLVDEGGNPVQLKGVSSHWLNFESDGYALNLTALEWMRDNWNLSLIRAAMGTNEDGGYLTSEANRAAMLYQVETIIANAVAAGVYVLVDWHSHMANEQEAQAVAFFEDMSSRYGHLPNVLFEIYNEPLNLDWRTVLMPYHQTVSDAIRDADADGNDNIIVLGTPNWDQDIEVVIDDSARVDGENLMYAVHFYACSHGADYLARAANALLAGVPVFVSEWGATQADGGVGGSPICETTANLWHNWMDANHVSWAAWKLDDCDWEIDNNGVADSSCLLERNAPLTGGWTSAYLNVHGDYVANKMQN